MVPDLLCKRSPWLSIVVVAMLAGCAVQGPAVEPSVPDPVQLACTPASETDVLLGNWLAVRSEKGVAGELRTLFTLQVDGSMAYTEQLKRPGQPSQGLSETGCWYREGQVLVMRSQESNSSPVDVSDPIYTNRYQVIAADEKMLRLLTPEGVQISARQMPSGYRLPF